MERVSTESRVHHERKVSPRYFVEDPRCGRAFWLSVLACTMSVILAIMFAVHVDPSAASKTADLINAVRPGAGKSIP